jgi:hypothetical protein
MPDLVRYPPLNHFRRPHVPKGGCQTWNRITIILRKRMGDHSIEPMVLSEPHQVYRAMDPIVTKNRSPSPMTETSLFKIMSNDIEGRRAKSAYRWRFEYKENPFQLVCP